MGKHHKCRRIVVIALLTFQGVNWLTEVRERGHASTNHLTSRILHISGRLITHCSSLFLEPTLPSPLIKSAILILFRLHRGVLIVWPKYTNEMIHRESLWAINSRRPDQPDHPIYLIILFQLIPNFLNNQLFIYIFGCGAVFARELHCRRWTRLHPVAHVAGNHCLSIEMKGIALTLLNITLMCLIHCFSMFLHN